MTGVRCRFTAPPFSPSPAGIGRQRPWRPTGPVRAMSSGVRWTSRAPRLSSRYARRLVPGIGTASGAWRENPGQRDLGGRGACMAAGNSFHRIDKLLVRRQVFVVKPGQTAAEIARSENGARSERRPSGIRARVD